MPSFVNPYTFIPLSRRTPIPARSSETEVSLTGVISCRLTAITPVIVPESKIETIEDAGIDKVNRCFRIGGKPAIPGSSLRGPIRSTYEALTNSCMHVNDELLSSAGGRKVPGLLRYNTEMGEYELYTADRYRVVDEKLRKDARTGRDWATGDEVFVTTKPEAEKNPFRQSSGVVASIGTDSIPDGMGGYYLRVNQMGVEEQDEDRKKDVGAGKNKQDKVLKNSPSVFVVREKVAQAVDGRYVEALRENIRQYVANSLESGNPGYLSPYPGAYQACFDRMCRGDATLPVWYSYEKEPQGSAYAFHFAWAQLSRSVYPVRTTDFVKQLGLQPCTDARRPLCPACELFGFVDQTGTAVEGARAGRVRFSDALAEGKVATETYLLPPLLSPRIHATEFYLKNARQRDSFSPMTGGTELAGRKFYWHHRDGIQELVVSEGQLAEGENRFATKVEAIAKGSTFHFDVYFDGISQLQLNELVFTLTLGKEWDMNAGRQWHKIGHGKPVGAGSVLIEVADVAVRSWDGDSYAIKGWEDYRLEKLEKPRQRATVLQRMPNCESVLKATRLLELEEGVAIDYPRTTASNDIFAWFVGNHDHTGRADQTIAGYRHVLPDVHATKQTLPKGFDTKKHPNFLKVGHPATTQAAGPEQKERGVVNSLKVNPGGWTGWISPAGGGGNIFFGDRKNPHIVNPHLLKGRRVEYDIIEVEREDRKTHRLEKQKQAINVRVV